MSPNAKRLATHLGLFVVTFLMAQHIQSTAYAVAIMTILLGHELGHYLMCRRYKVEATFPIFIPMPNVFGTLGAVIAMKSPIPNRKALFDIGITGPITGLILAIPAIFIGLMFSEIQPTTAQGIYFGEPLLFTWLSKWVLGPLPEGHVIMASPIAFAGWAALFVTSINFIPVGQLDGGHVLYAMLGRKGARIASWIMVVMLVCFGHFFHPLWYFFAVLLLLFVMRHPAPTDDQTPLDRRRKIIGILTFLFIMSCFTPVPFDLRM